MARHRTITRQQLAPQIMARGPVSATELAAMMGVHRTSIVRALAQLGSELVTLGSGRSTRYLLRREVRNAGNHWPLYTIGESGRARHWGTLETVHDRKWRVVWNGGAPEWAPLFCADSGLWDGFPFFLADVRPQGFLGRAAARQVSPHLGLPENPLQWSDDHTLLYLHAAGEDVPGSVVVGDDCLRRAQQRVLFPATGEVTAESERESRYPELARDAMRGPPGSSAGGEQPKFLTTLTTSASAREGARRDVLVKFSPPLDQPAGRRWADLLACEHLSLEILSAHGLTIPGAQILDCGGRRFIEVPRFDRTPAGGRRGVVSLMALQSALCGFSDAAWPAAVCELLPAGLLEADCARTVQLLHAFGTLTGNTDMHSGNLAFWLEDTLPLRIAPAYDMLPMLWAPTMQGELVPREFTPAPPLPSERAAWRAALPMASEFWHRACEAPLLSPEFRQIARTALAALQRVAAHAA